MALEEYDRYIESLKKDDDYDIPEFVFPKGYASPGYYSMYPTDIIVENYSKIQEIIHKESFTKEDITSFLMSFIYLIGASNAQDFTNIKNIYQINITNFRNECWYLGTEPHSIYGCKLNPDFNDKDFSKLVSYVDFLKHTFLLFLKRLNETNPEFIPLLKSMEFLQEFDKAIQCLFYFAASKFRGFENTGDINIEFGFGEFILELQTLVPDTIEVLCNKRGYGRSRLVFFKPCKNKEGQGKTFIGCMDHEGDFDEKSYKMAYSEGPMCGAAVAGNEELAAAGAPAEAAAVAAPEAAGGAGLDPAAAAPTPRRARNTRRSRNSRKRRNSRRRH